MDQSNQPAFIPPRTDTLCTNTCNYQFPLLNNTMIVYEHHTPLFLPVKTCGLEKLSIYVFCDA